MSVHDSSTLATGPSAWVRTLGRSGVPDGRSRLRRFDATRARGPVLALVIATLVVGSPFGHPAGSRSAAASSFPAPGFSATAVSAPQSVPTVEHASTAPAPSSGGLRAAPPLGWGLGPGSPYNGSEPAPMGVSDQGVDPGGGSHSYATASFQGSISIAELSAYNASILGAQDEIGFQLNAFLGFDSGSSSFVYWVQDVFEVNTSSKSVDLYDNIWNATSNPLPEIDASAVSGNGSFSSFTYDGQSETYYGDGASCTYSGACAVLVYGLGQSANITLRLNASLTAGRPTVRFMFDDGLGAQWFDQATFSLSVAPAAFQGFFVNAGALSASCARCVGDVELIAGGPNSGYQTALNGLTNVSLGIERWNGHNYESVPDAYDYGLATAEGLSDATVRLASDAEGEPSARMTYGAGTLGPVWGSGSVSVVGVSVVSGHAGGALTVNGTSVPFLGQYVEFTLVPSTYALSVDSGSVYPLGDRTLLGGEDLTLEVGRPGVVAVVFVPQGLGTFQVWSVTLGGETLNGTGNITFGEPRGNYTFAVGSLTGFASSPSGGNVSVNGSGTNVTVPVRWTSTQTGLLAEIVSILELRLGPVPFYVLLLILIVLGVGAGVASRRPRSRTRFIPPPSPPPSASTGESVPSPYEPAPSEPPHRTFPP